jgi:WD40 repeat protein
LQKAKAEEKKAQEQQLETVRQRELAEQRAEEARLAKIVAETESGKALAAKKAAELDRQIAEKQKVISDSLRFESEESEKKATGLRLLALAQNLAIKSKLADKNTYSQQVKTLLAVQAYRFNKRYGGNPLDVEIFGALFSAIRLYQREEEYLLEHDDEVKSICYSRLSGDLASTGVDGRVIIQSSEGSGKNLISNDQELIYDHLVYNDKGDRLAVTGDDRSIHIFKAGDIAKPITSIQKLHPNKIIAIEWFGDKLITACLDSNIRIIDIENKKVEYTYNILQKPLSIDFNLEKKLLVTGCENGTIYQLHVEHGNDFQLLKKSSNAIDRILSVSLNHDATLVAYGTSNASCFILSMSNGATISSLSGHTGRINHIRFHPNKNELATSSLDNKVRLYTSIVRGVQPIVFAEHDNWAYDVVFHPSKNILASCSKDKSVRTYPISSDEIAASLIEKLNRNMSKEEWDLYIGKDVEYEKINESLN